LSEARAAAINLNSAEAANNLQKIHLTRAHAQIPNSSRLIILTLLTVKRSEINTSAEGRDIKISFSTSEAHFLLGKNWGISRVCAEVSRILISRSLQRHFPRHTSLFKLIFALAEYSGSANIYTGGSAQTWAVCILLKSARDETNTRRKKAAMQTGMTICITVTQPCLIQYIF